MEKGDRIGRKCRLIRHIVMTAGLNRGLAFTPCLPARPSRSMCAACVRTPRFRDPSVLREPTLSRDPPRNLPFETVSQLWNVPAAVARHRIRLRGSAKASATGGFEFRDSSGTAAIRSSKGLDLSEERALDALAFVVMKDNGIALDGLTEFGGEPVRVKTASGNSLAAPTVLTSVAQVHAMTPDAASREAPVLLAGVITYCEARTQQVFFQDQSGGIYVSSHGT